MPMPLSEMVSVPCSVSTVTTRTGRVWTFCLAMIPAILAREVSGVTVQKVAKYSIGADEAVVADIPERVGVTTLRAKGFT